MPLPLTVRAVDRVLVALEAGHGESGESEAGLSPGEGRAPRGGIASAARTVLAAEVLASWFGASLQFVTSDDAASAQLESLSGTIGLRTDPVLVLPVDRFSDRLEEHATHHAPCVVVAAADDANLSFARSASQPTYLVAPGPRHRQPSGPLYVQLDQGNGGDAVALASVWAQALDLAVHIVPATGADGPAPGGDDPAERVRARLQAMGIEAEVCREHDPMAHALAGADKPLAMVVGAGHIDEARSQLEAILTAGGSVLVAPASSTPRRPVVDLVALHDLSVALGSTSDDPDGLDALACAAVLSATTIGRLAYVERGWPVVVPVNFSVNDGDIFIRSVRGGKLDAALRHDRVCFEVDTISAIDSSGRSVIIHGHLEMITDPATLQAAWDNEPTPWVDHDQTLWLRLVALATTGRHVGPAGT